MDRKRVLSIFNLLVFIGTIVVNFLANQLPINNLTTGEISALYPNLFTPAGFTFSIWGLIYTLLGIFTVYQLIVAFNTKKKEQTFVDKIGIWNIILGIGNMSWIFAWHYLYIGTSVIIMLVMLISLIMIYRNLGIGKGSKPKKEIYFVFINFSVYLGWISIATIANITTFLVSIDWNGFGISQPFWTVIVMSIGIILGLLFIFKHNDIFYGLVINWALFGIYITRTSEGTVSIPSIIACSVIGIVIISICIIYALIRKSAYIFNN
ncbi:tryptophan-rich sensory protein [Serpentinicella sp. ANB-PHB4]|uniref:tryptophan-rich sensory protein n=1 Tax=Serpentinicella sp. ANB-PHB4 TaxID=3074076 RepID=UPI00285453F2|nr:tryptophan-rich sensory protein [Serpentinicella sp. ANB-PHB4]MDR5658003.1 tryptophan-rich sensory protein [Serpentinicella sp. ANB-PHB4]